MAKRRAANDRTAGRGATPPSRMVADKGTCQCCGRAVPIRMAGNIRVAANHRGPTGGLCPGTGLAAGGIPKTAPVRAEPKKAVTTKAAKSKGAKGTYAARPGKLSAQERQAIRASEAMERAERNNALWSEFGGRKSVRTVGGGLPTLGKNRR